MKHKEDFNKFIKVNWSELVEGAEKATGESYSGLEPLLTKDEVIEYAKEIYNEKNKDKI